MNPYQPNDSQKSTKTRDVIGLILGIATILFGGLTVLGAVIGVDLFFRYPGLRDPSSGPAYYWPSDAFEIVGIFCMAMFLVFALSFGLFCKRKHQKREKNRESENTLGTMSLK